MLVQKQYGPRNQKKESKQNKTRQSKTKRNKERKKEKTFTTSVYDRVQYKNIMYIKFKNFCKFLLSFFPNFLY